MKTNLLVGVLLTLALTKTAGSPTMSDAGVVGNKDAGPDVSFSLPDVSFTLPDLGGGGECATWPRAAQR